MSQILTNLIKKDLIESNLKKNSSSKSAVKALQTSLYEIGFGKELNWKKFGADGGFGNSTAAAVKAFASKLNIESTGEQVSSEMANKIVKLQEVAGGLRAIKKALDKNDFSSLKRGSSNKTAVSGLQRVLNMLGFGQQLNWEKFGADGDYGGSTTAAVAALGKGEGIPTDGTQLNAALATKILESFTPLLGDQWEEAKSISPLATKRRGTPQFYRLFPKGDRDFKGIKATREKAEAEFYRDSKSDPKETRTYRYTFESGCHEIPGETLDVSYHAVKKLNSNNQQISSFCYPVDHEHNNPKDQIVLHFTAGQTLGDIKTLTQEDYHVSTAYILGRDGAIYRLFSPEQWAYHLGDTGFSPRKLFESRSIGIEISNYGWLEEDGLGNLNFASGSLFCSLEDTDAYVKLKKPYRGKTYFAAYTSDQYESLIVLLRYLTKQYNIEKKFLSAPTELVDSGNWEAIPRFSKFKNQGEADAFRGICSHVNYRNNGKWDLGPFFDWERVIAGTTADTFTPNMSRSFSLKAPMRTEEELLMEASKLDYGNQDTDKYGPNGPEVDI